VEYEVSEFLENLKKFGLDPLKVAKLSDLDKISHSKCGESSCATSTVKGYLTKDIALNNPVSSILDSFKPLSYSGMKYFLKIIDMHSPQNNRYSEIIISHDGSAAAQANNVFYTEAAIIYNGLISNFLLNVSLVGSGLDKEISLDLTALTDISVYLIRLSLD